MRADQLVNRFNLVSSRQVHNPKPYTRVLRSLERLLLRFPEKAKKAQAALTIRTARTQAAAHAVRSI